MSYKILRTPQYKKWLASETKKSKSQIEKRIIKIENEGHFGAHKFLDDELYELKWRNGRRVYYAHLRKYNILLLLGGNKNGQQKDIKLSKKIFSQYAKERIRTKTREDASS